MDNTQAAQLLTLASGSDRIRRTPDEVKVWALALANVDYQAAEHALIEFIADPLHGTEFLKPAHLTAIIARKRSTAALLPRADVMCDIHDGYPVNARTGRCDQCTRYPGDRALGVRPPTRHLSELALTVGHTIPEEA